MGMHSQAERCLNAFLQPADGLYRNGPAKQNHLLHSAHLQPGHCGRLSVADTLPQGGEGGQVRGQKKVGVLKNASNFRPL